MLVKKRYNSYREYLKKEHRGRVQKISLRANFTCPNRDGSVATGGCTFCNNDSFSDVRKKNVPVANQILDTINHYDTKRNDISGYIAYFQSFSNTYGSLEYLKSLYTKAIEHPRVLGLSIGTRPDCIDIEKLSFLEELNKTHEVHIEYGAESIYNSTLSRINRGHDFKCLYEAIELTHHYKIKICVHVILGFPWESREQWIQMAKVLSAMPITFIKIHQLLIVQGTALAREHQKHSFKLLTENEYLSVLGEFVQHLRPEIVIQRMYSKAMGELLLAPDWCEKMVDFNTKIDSHFDDEDINQGALYDFNSAQAALAAAVTQVPCSLISSKRQLQ